MKAAIIAALTLCLASSATIDDARTPPTSGHAGACGSLEREAGCRTIWRPADAICVCPPVIVANPGPCPDYDDCSV